MRRFAECYLTADSKAHAARLAGYPEDRARITAQRLLQHPGVKAVIAEERAKLAEQWGIKRDQLVSMLLESHRKAASSTEEIAAIREIGKLLGLYAPEHKEVTNRSTDIHLIEQMSDEDLLHTVGLPADSLTN